MTACAPLDIGAGTATAMADPAHNSRNALDWAGTYAGVLPCADCPDVQARLRLPQTGANAGAPHLDGKNDGKSRRSGLRCITNQQLRRLVDDRVGV